MTGLLVGAGIILACNVGSWFIADRTDGRWTEDRILAYLYACAIGVLCAVIW